MCNVPNEVKCKQNYNRTVTFSLLASKRGARCNIPSQRHPRSYDS